MERVLVHWRLLGARPCRPAGADGTWYDGVDLAVELVDGSVRALGLRTPECFAAGSGGWTIGHVPFTTDLDPARVRSWSFDRVLWLGPAPRPCVVWTNAIALSEPGIDSLLRSPRSAPLLAGPDGSGLPLLSELVGIGS